MSNFLERLSKMQQHIHVLAQGLQQLETNVEHEISGSNLNHFLLSHEIGKFLCSEILNFAEQKSSQHNASGDFGFCNGTADDIVDLLPLRLLVEETMSGTSSCRSSDKDSPVSTASSHSTRSTNGLKTGLSALWQIVAGLISKVDIAASLVDYTAKHISQQDSSLRIRLDTLNQIISRQEIFLQEVAQYMGVSYASRRLSLDSDVFQES